MIFNPAGGLTYHFRAMRYRNRLWTPYRRALTGWLEAWNPSESGLIIIGPSAAWCYDLKFLKRFKHIVCVDPDPVARVIFRRRLRQALPLKERPKLDPNLEWTSQDFFASASGFDAFSEFLNARQGYAVLFSNILGQLKILVDPKHEKEILSVWKKRLQSSLTHRSWASFHDRLSGELSLNFDQPLSSPHRLTDQEVLKAFYKNAGSGELTDHETEGFFAENLEHFYFHWTLLPNWNHLIEAVRGQR